MAKLEYDMSDANCLFIDAKLKRHDIKPTTQEHRQLTRNMWQAAGDALRQARDGQFIDSEIADWLLHSINEILANQTPNEIAHLYERGRGAPPDTLDIKEAKTYAILYVQAVKNKDIEDRSPIKTIAEMYECKTQTIRDWTKQYPNVQWTEYQKHRSLEQRISSLKRLLKRNSRHYQEQSRAFQATDRRLRNRQAK
jgi:hypothetical protein